MTMPSLTSMHLAWLTWSLILLLIWGIVRYRLKSREVKREMLVVSICTSFLGFTEPLFVPAYWDPPSLFDLAWNTGFDLESFIFSFAIGGLGYALYMVVFPVEHEPEMPRDERLEARHKYHLPLLLSTPAIFIVLLIATPLNPIYDAVIAMVLGGISTWYCRPDLKKKMLVSAMLFLCLYSLYFFTLILLFPGFVERVWNIPAISGILVAGIPAEELLFALAFGFYWSTVYEHFTWKKVPESSIPGYE
jgi:Lycopene cyclase